MEAMFEAKMAVNFPKINVRYQPTDSGSSENMKQDKREKKLHLGTLY